MIMKINFSAKNSKVLVAIKLVESNESETLLLPTGAKEVRLGIGKRGGMTRRKLMLLPRMVVAMAKKARVKKFTVNFGDFVFPHLKIGRGELAEIMAVNFQLANFEFVRYKTKPKEGWNFIKEIIVRGAISHADKAGFQRGLTIGEEINACRALANTPGGDMTPTILAVEARKAAAGTRATVKVLDLRQIRKLGMGGVLGVAKGSDEEPKFIIVEYHGSGKKDKPMVLVGKGVTFDTGGINLKTDGGKDMHMDMSGGAAVIHAVVLAAKLKLKKNIVALVPAVENMPSGSSYHPGDVLRTMSGQTIEVLNTDAEGRVILSDALTYAKRYDPALVVDVATLTGAAEVALGNRASAIFSKDDILLEKIRALGEESGDYVWPLPLWDEYENDIKGTFGDWANTGSKGARGGGAINGAMFLYQFAKDYRWLHIDIVPRMISIDGDYLAKGATGEPIRLLMKILEKL